MNEVTVIKPEQFGLQKKEATNIEKAFEPKIKEREILSSQYGELIQKDITQETCAEATQLRRKLVKVRTGISDIHKAQKSFFLAAGKFVDAWKNKETVPVTQMEDGLKKIENHFAEIKEVENEVIRKERNAELAKYEIEYDMGDIAFMTPDGWRHFLSGVKSEFEEKKAEEARVERKRIEDNKKQDLFVSRKEKLIQFSQFNLQNELNLDTTEKEFVTIVEKGEKLKAEFEAEQKRIKAENKKLKEEAELKRISDEKAEIERQRVAKIELDRLAKEQLERLKLERKNREIQKAKEDKERAAHELELKLERAAKERLQKEFEARKEIERKRKETEQLDLIRIRKEKEAEANAKRKAELAPDKERMTKWISDMVIIDIVNARMSKESVLMASEIIDKFNAFKNWATEKVNEIK